MHPILSWTLFIGVAGAAYITVFGIPKNKQGRDELNRQQRQHRQQARSPQAPKAASSKSGPSGKKKKDATSNQKAQQTAGSVQNVAQKQVEQVAQQAQRVTSSVKETAEKLTEAAASAVKDVSQQGKGSDKKKDKKQASKATKSESKSEGSPNQAKQQQSKNKVKTASWYQPDAKLDVEDESPVQAVMNGYVAQTTKTSALTLRRPRKTSTPIGRQPNVKQVKDNEPAWEFTSKAKTPEAVESSEQHATSDEEEEEEDDAPTLQGNRFFPMLPDSSKGQHLAGQAFASQRKAHITDDMLDPDTAFAARTLKIVPSTKQQKPAPQKKQQQDQGELTKKQRQNQAKKAKLQAEKEAAREAQEQALRRHLKQREQERIAELAQQAQMKAHKSSSAWPANGEDWQTVNKKKVGAGQSASVVDGKLIWE